MNTNRVTIIQRVADQPYLLLWVYLLVVILAELLISFASPQLGMILHALLIVGMINHSVVGQLDAERRLALALTLAPLIRVLSLALPLASSCWETPLRLMVEQPGNPTRF